MKLSSLLGRLQRSPLVASVQGSPKSPVDHPETLLRLARASVQEGVQVLRLEGVKSIRLIKPEIGVPIIGLLKRSYPRSDVYITPTIQDAEALIDLGVDIIAVDATLRQRPRNENLAKLIARIKAQDTLVLADCDSLESARAATEAGADLVGTTLAGYTDARPATEGPDLELLREIASSLTVPLLAEGRYTERWQIETALRIGANGVVVGGALNDPVKQTRALKPLSIGWKPRPGVELEEAETGAVDIGGTWLRFAMFTRDWRMVHEDRTPNPPKREDRLQWIRDKIAETGVTRLGLGTGGVTDPHTGEVWMAKEYLMHDQLGIVFHEETLGIPVFPHGDGHASAWAHANLPQFAGLRVATLAIGTGVGCGYVREGKIWAGRRGEYPRVNDLPTAQGKTYEELMGGIHLTKTPTSEQQEAAVSALEGATEAIRGLYFPDEIVICGSVGLSPWLAPHLEKLGLKASPFGADAGIYGAAALALFPDYM